MVRYAKNSEWMAEMTDVRMYRKLLVTAGQASPPDLGYAVVEILKELHAAGKLRSKISVIDVGCGLGHQMALIKNSLPDMFARVEGIDWSPATVAKHQSDPKSVYDKVTLCGSDKLPFADSEFDLALSMENIEHLYGQLCVGAVAEMARVAASLIVTTPLPSDCINFAWLYPETIEAILDDVPLSEHDFVCLESAVHKSTVFPASMVSAGFLQMGHGHGYYVGASARIDVGLIRGVGIDQARVYLRDGVEVSHLKGRYLRLLAQSAVLHTEIVESPFFENRETRQVERVDVDAPSKRRERSWVPKILRRKRA